MADDTIVSGGTFTLSSPLTSGTNIDFINSPAVSGELIVSTPDFVISTIVTAGTTSVSSITIGGEIRNFQPSPNLSTTDQVLIANVDSLFATLDFSPNAAAENRSFDNAIAFSAEGAGGYLIMPNGSVVNEVHNPNTLDATATLILDEIRTGLFGTSANDTTLSFAGMISGGTVNAMITDVGGVAINACFAAGTRILTTAGEVEVERLAVGDRVITRGGEDEQIIWIGHRDLDISRHPRPDQVRPIIVEPDALAEGVPARRLVLSPDHALYLDGVLVPAKDLVNATTIRGDGAATSVRYFHVELAAHNVLFAEGAAAESFLDTGHRGVFTNAAEPLLLHPDLMQQRREAEGCAPLCTGGSKLDAIRERLARRRLPGRRLG